MTLTRKLWSSPCGAGSVDGVAGSAVPVVTLHTRCISLRAKSADEAIGRRESVVDGAVRARAGQGRSGVGASYVAGVLAGRPDPGGVDEPGCPRWAGTRWVRRCRSRICGSPAAVPRWRGWREGARKSPAAARAAVAEVEAFCADTGYQLTRFDADAVAAAELLRRVGPR